MEGWDLALLVVAGYLAVVSLIRLMARHRDRLVERFSREMAEERKLKQREADQQKQKQLAAEQEKAAKGRRAG